MKDVLKRPLKIKKKKRKKEKNVAYNRMVTKMVHTILYKE